MVTPSATVNVPEGLKVVALSPFMMPNSYAFLTLSAYHSLAGTSLNIPSE